MQVILDQLKLQADLVDIKKNDIMSQYFLRLRPGGTVRKIENRTSEIALGLRSKSIPLVKLIPEEGLISLEVLTEEMGEVSFSNILPIMLADESTNLPIILGKDYSNAELIADITKMPHLLVSGTTGSGKSVMLHSIVCSLMLQEKAEVKLALVDPKNVEFSYYKDVKQLMYPIANYVDEANAILSDLVQEMDNRFRLMAKASVNSIQEYNSKKKKQMPYIVLIIDEYSDLMQLSNKKEFQQTLGRLAQKSRACGIHIIIATQRPSADVVTGLIKANCPAVISFRVTSLTNSRVVLDQGGAEKLLGKGDGLINSSVYNMVRFKGAFLSNEEIKKVCESNKRTFWDKVKGYFQND